MAGGAGALLVLCYVAGAVGSASTSRGSGVDEPARASALQVIYSRENQHAASELRRYLYLITAELPALTLLEEAGLNLQLPSAQQEQLPIVLAGPRADDPLAHALLTAIDAGWSTAALGSAAGEHDHVLRSSTAVVCHGATTLATRYAVYSLLETLGVGFRLHGQDAVPRLRTSEVVERLQGLPQQQNLSPGTITTRGIQPFHDFSEGPDQWNEDDYKAHLEQLTKLKLNFIGLHTYPYREPTVWTGLPGQFDPQTGEVNISYNTSYMTTRGGGDWGGVLFNSTNSSVYTFGSDQILAGGPKTPECYGSDLLDGHGSCLLPSYGTAQQANELFNSVGQMLTNAFRWAKRVGVKTCVGTEADHSQSSPQKRPPSIPTQTKQTELYIGIFERLLALGTPLDYYWIWTSEGWPARATFPRALPITDPSVKNVVAEFQAADAAKKAVGARMENISLATCGWTLGPGADRAYFDKVLPAGWTLSSINEAVGNTPTEAAYANVTKHDKWAIPWLEDDPGLLAPQLWVNRTLEYSAQAAGYGVNGLLGIHWRVREVAPQLSALARYPWQRNITSLQVWEDFFASEFGGGGSAGAAAAAAVAAVAKQAAEILSSVDSFKLPRPDNWIGGPGGIVQNTNVTACNALDGTGSTKESDYAFVEAFHALRPQLVAATTKGNNGTSSAAAAVLARYEFWAESLEYMRQMALVGCHWDKLQRCIDKLPSTCNVSLKQQLSHNQCVKGQNFACVGPSMWSLVILQIEVSSSAMAKLCDATTMGTVRVRRQSSRQATPRRRRRCGVSTRAGS